jgi:hypothetical protein
LGLTGDGFKLKLGAFGSSAKVDPDDDDAKEFGAGFKGYNNDHVDSYRSGRGVFARSKLDTKMDAENEQLFSAGDNVDIRKRKTLGSGMWSRFA